MIAKSKRKGLLLAMLGLIAGLCVFLVQPVSTPLRQKLMGRRTVTDVLETLGPAAKSRLRPHFEEAGVSFPPRARLALNSLPVRVCPGYGHV